jgi:RNA polymerase sigma factor (sigma-70 family)
MNLGTKAATSGEVSLQDKILVEGCLLGNQDAWSALIEKYKNLIYSIPVKYGLSPEDAAEIFQSVSLTLLKDLSKLREPQALAAWLIKLTARKCLRWKQEHRTASEVEIDEERIIETLQLPDDLLQQIEREQILREGLALLSPECKKLVELLFYSNPPLHYDQAAERLGLAKGSIGATRMRCLEKLRRFLERRGFKP